MNNNSCNNNYSLKIFNNSNNNIDHYYSFTNKLYNRSPNYIIKIESSEQLKDALRFAKSLNKRISIRSGGHSCCSFSILDNTINLDMSGLKDIKINLNENTAIVQSGVTMLEYYNETTKYGLASPGGTCPSVGMGGIALAGGTNYLSPLYGYLVDNVLEFTVLLENGELVQANKTNKYNDLYWALAGSGHGGFGIVVDYKIQLYPIEPYYYENIIHYNYEDTNNILKVIDNYVRNGDQYLLDRIGIGIDSRFSNNYNFDNNSNVKINCVIIYFYNGPAKRGEFEFRKFYSLFKDHQLKVNVNEFEYLKIRKSFLDIIKSVPMDNGTFRQFSKCRFLANLNASVSNTFTDIIDLGFKTIKNQLLEKDNIEISASIYYQGGKQSQLEDPTRFNSFIHRGSQYNWVVVFICKYGNESNDPPILEYKNQINKQLPIFHESIYQNYPDDDVSDWQYRYYGSNYPKLQQIKLKYDSNNYFKFQQSIELPNTNNNKYENNNHNININSNNNNNLKSLIKL